MKETQEFSVLGLVGPAGSGKDLVADWFVENQKFVKVALADPMKRFVMRAFPGISETQLWGPSEERNREFDINDTWWYEAIGHFGEASKEIAENVLDDIGNRVVSYLGLYDWFSWLRKTYPEKISARVILQTLGTEWGRKVDPLLWVKYAHKTAKFIREGYSYTQVEGWKFFNGDEYAGVIIPDHRFENEVEFTQENDGYVIRLRRVSLEGREGNVGIKGHPSEVEMHSIPEHAFDFILHLEEGVDKVEWALRAITGNKSWETKRKANNRLPL